MAAVKQSNKKQQEIEKMVLQSQWTQDTLTQLLPHSMLISFAPIYMPPLLQNRPNKSYEQKHSFGENSCSVLYTIAMYMGLCLAAARS